MKYSQFISKHQTPLFSEIGAQLNEFLKDIKLLRKIKENELNSHPKEPIELLSKKIINKKSGLP